MGDKSLKSPQVIQDDQFDCSILAMFRIYCLFVLQLVRMSVWIVIDLVGGVYGGGLDDFYKSCCDIRM
jgi:hypothetical protein